MNEQQVQQVLEQLGVSAEQMLAVIKVIMQLSQNKQLEPFLQVLQSMAGGGEQGGQEQQDQQQQQQDQGQQNIFGQG